MTCPTTESPWYEAVVPVLHKILVWSVALRQMQVYQARTKRVRAVAPAN